MANNDNKKAFDARSDPRSITEGVASIPPTTFYGTQPQSQRPPPLPQPPRSPALGSASTGHYTIQASEKSPFREPELWVAGAPAPTWGTFEDGWNNGSARRSVPIGGRNDIEETRWWDAQVREFNARPGPGILPPVLADQLHNSEHTLFSVSVTPPDLKPPLPPVPAPPQPEQSESPKRHRSSDSGSSLHGCSSSAPTSAHASATWLPTAEDVHTAVPHPNAYYCRKHNGWVLLIWKSSSMHLPCEFFQRLPPGPFSPPVDELCSFYVIASHVIPGVIPVKLLEDLVKNKVENPPLDKSGELAALIALEMILMIIENRVWKAETRTLPVSRKTFQTKLGWNDTISRIFTCLGFEITQIPDPPDLTLSPPHIDDSTPAGRLARSKLLRAWVELEAGFAHVSPHKLWVKIDSAREKLLAFAYFAQVRCDPAQTVEYFSSFYTVCQMVTSLTDEPSQMLQSFVFEERERGRFTRDDFLEAPGTLGFGPNGPLSVDYDYDVPDDFVEKAWREAVRRAWREGADGLRLTAANDAFRRIAEVRGSEALWKKWEQAKDGGMTPERAYATLEVPSEIEDGMLITVFSMRVDDQPNQVDRMREAVSVIAEMRNSDRLRKFLETGSDPGETVPATRQDWPRGLNQLGNTCYLNSLLQYFYTIKDLRDAVAPLLNSSRKTMDEDKLTDDDLKRHRVGGRLVTRKEILRSKKFVSELAELFWHLEHADIASVTPTMELAKLALTTSSKRNRLVERTDATLVEDAPAPRADTGSPVGSPGASSSSVLGKRARDKEADVGSRMSIDSSRRRAGPSGLSASPGAGVATDVEMKDAEATAQSGAKPPLPQRKTSESVMMFGRQHDVSECMDNCVFQIETALLNVVKRLFYGTLRQRLIAPDRKGRGQCQHTIQKTFFYTSCQVSDEGYDIYDGLSSYFHSTAQLDSNTLSMEITLLDLPPVLQIQLQVQWDRETGQSWKSQAYVNANPDKRARSKDILSELSSDRFLRHLSKHHPSANNFSSTQHISRLQETIHLPELDDQLLSDIRAEHLYVNDELDNLYKDIASLKQELENLWRDEHEAVYELTSVFIHRGATPQWGHYFFYSRHLPENPDSWFKYNDSEVSVVSKEEVLANTTGSTANPYMLVFVRKGSDMISTVKRCDPMTMTLDDA
ncbi:hypothetical protein EI94DRAFT_1774682 [Lactarius quietus]|nr:hypothetical protein EI94DRAFT_1774682 [Lactarius quietus]